MRRNTFHPRYGKTEATQAWLNGMTPKSNTLREQIANHYDNKAYKGPINVERLYVVLAALAVFSFTLGAGFTYLLVWL